MKFIERYLFEDPMQQKDSNIFNKKSNVNFLFEIITRFLLPDCQISDERKRDPLPNICIQAMIP